MNKTRHNIAAPRPQPVPAASLFKAAEPTPPVHTEAVVTVVDNAYTPHMRMCMLLIGAIVCILIIITVLVLVKNTHKAHLQFDTAPNILKQSGLLVADGEVVPSELTTVVYEFKMTKQIQKWDTIPSASESIPGIELNARKIVEYDVCCFEPDEEIWSCANSPYTLSFLTKLKLINNGRSAQLLVHALSLKYAGALCVLKTVLIT